jgi:hypothetical protein
LIELADGAGALASLNVEACLVDLYPDARDLVEQEVARRSGSPPASPQPPDGTLALLRRVVRRAAKD